MARDDRSQSASSGFSLTSFLQRLFSQSDSTASTTEPTAESTDATEDTDASAETSAPDEQSKTKTPTGRQLYRLIPNYSVKPAKTTGSRCRGRNPIRSLRSSETEPSRLIIGLHDGNIDIWVYAPATEQKISETVVNAGTTAPIQPADGSVPADLSDIDILDQYFDLTVEDETAFRTLRYSWESPERCPLANQSISITDLIRRVNRLPSPLLFTIEFVSGADVQEIGICRVRFTARLFVSADCSPGDFGHVEQALRSVFKNTTLSPTLYQQDETPAFQHASRDNLSNLISLPKPTELHQLNLVGTDTPIDTPDMSLPSAYIDPSLPLGWPYDSQGTKGKTPVGYGQSRQPVTLLRVNPSRPETPRPTSPRSEYLANIRALATTSYPVFVLHTRPLPHKYLQAIDAELESHDEINIRYATERSFGSWGVQTGYEVNSRIKNIVLLKTQDRGTIRAF